MSSNYNGLTRNTWTGTWSPTGNHPIALTNELRGGLRTITGAVGDYLTDIPGQRIDVGMLVFVTDPYGAVQGNSFYIYALLAGEDRDLSTGSMPNADTNWTRLALQQNNVGSIVGYSHTQSPDSNTWTIIHNLGTEDVQIQTYDTNKELIIPDNITILDINTIVVLMSTPISGKAIITGIT